MQAIKVFPYVPEVNYRLISPQDSSKVIKLLQPFSKNQTFFISLHANTAGALKGRLHSTDQASINIRVTYLDHLKELDKCISSILSSLDNLISEFSEDFIDNQANRRFYSEFQTVNLESSKLEFLKLLSTYEILKFYNHKIQNSWKTLKDIFSNIEISSMNRKFMHQILVYKIYPRLDLTYLTDLLIRRLGYILMISSEKMTETRYTAKGTYFNGINYSFSTVFNPEIVEVVNNLNEISDNNQKIKKSIKSYKDIKESCLINDYNIDCRCEELFNQLYTQIMQINSYRSKVEESKIQKCIYFEKNIAIEEKKLRQELIRSYMAKVSPKGRQTQYNEFLNEYFNFIYSVFTTHFGSLTETEHVLLMYHFSPGYFIRDIIHHMKKSKSGFIHYLVSRDTIMRELPGEYIKHRFIYWWDENIYGMVSRVEKNSREKYKKILSIITDMWYKDLPDILKKIEENIHIKRAFEIHNLNLLKPVLEAELSYSFFLLYSRFLGNNFVYNKPSHYSKESMRKQGQKELSQIKEKEEVAQTV